MKRKRIVIPFAALSLIALVAFSNVKAVSANAASNGNELVFRIAERFGLDEAEVQETFVEFRALKMSERHEEMQEHFSLRLEEAVETGSITDAQQLAIIEKHDEMNSRRDELDELSPEDRREAMADHREEMEAWAEENGIDIEILLKFNNHPDRGARHVFTHMK